MAKSGKKMPAQKKPATTKREAQSEAPNGSQLAYGKFGGGSVTNKGKK